MAFSKKIKQFFYIEKGLSNNEISKMMDGYSTSMISRYLNSDSISHTFIQKIIKYFPDADIKYLISEDEETKPLLVEEPRENYGKAKQLVEEIELKLKELKTLL
jgi:predicted transcriptional regulator